MESTVLAIKGDKDTNPLKVVLVPWSKPYIKLQQSIITNPAKSFSIFNITTIIILYLKI